MSEPNLDDYVPVNERIGKFYERFPDGRLVREAEPEYREIGERLFIIYRALAYRTPDDPKPGQGMAWEPFPGPTAFTQDSELMNSETAAWGRAIAACGIEVNRGIATQEDVRARSDDNGQRTGVPPGDAGQSSNGVPQPKHRGPAHVDKRISEGKGKRAWAIQKEHSFTNDEKRHLFDHFGVQDYPFLDFRDYDLFIEFCERKHPLPAPEAEDVPAPDVEAARTEGTEQEVPF